MTDYSELLERLDNFADYESENKEAAKAIRALQEKLQKTEDAHWSDVNDLKSEIEALQEQVKELKSKISKFIYGEENPDWVDPEQTKITELQEEVKEWEEKAIALDKYMSAKNDSAVLAVIQEIRNKAMVKE